MRNNRTCQVQTDARVQPRVEALGVADVLRIAMAPSQTRWLLDEVRELRGALEQQDPSKPSARDVHSDLRVLARLASELLPVVDDGAIVFGPAPLMSELVSGATRHVVDVLSERLAQHPAKAAHDAVELQALATAVAAWVESYLAMLSIEWFDLDD